METQRPASPPAGRAAPSTAELRLQNDRLSLVVVPAHGGRIISLVHRATQRELLWRQPPRPDWPRYGVPESDADIQGWDECCPAIGPGAYPSGPWEGVSNPAQGEVYVLPWNVHHADQERVILSVHGVRFPYQLEREVALVEPSAVRTRYRIANHAALPFPFIWSAHPLLIASVGGHITLSQSVHEVIVDSTEGGRLVPIYGRIAWPRARVADGSEVDLSVVQPGTGWADKLYVPHIADGRCALVRNDGLTVQFRWDAATIPSLGIWIDTRGAGEARVALEPCLGFPDALAAAAEWGRCALLPPGGEQTWEITVQVSSRGSEEDDGATTGDAPLCG